MIATTAMLMACSRIGADPMQWVTAMSAPPATPSADVSRSTDVSAEEVAGQAAFARLLFAEPDARPAVDALSQIAQIDTNLKTPELARIEAALQRGELNEAHSAAGLLVQRRAGEAIAHQMMGAVLRALGDHTAARVSFERSIAIDALFVQAIASLAQLDMQEGKTDVALARFEAAIAKGSVSPTLRKGYEALLRDAGLELNGKTATLFAPVTLAQH